MEDYERERIEVLTATDAELRGLWEQHLDFEKQLDAFDRQVHLSTAEQVERKLVQKRKLAGKDRIAEILALHQLPAHS